MWQRQADERIYGASIGTRTGCGKEVPVSGEDIIQFPTYHLGYLNLISSLEF